MSSSFCIQDGKINIFILLSLKLPLWWQQGKTKGNNWTWEKGGEETSADPRDWWISGKWEGEGLILSDILEWSGTAQRDPEGVVGVGGILGRWARERLQAQGWKEISSEWQIGTNEVVYWRNISGTLRQMHPFSSTPTHPKWGGPLVSN